MEYREKTALAAFVSVILLIVAVTVFATASYRRSESTSSPPVAKVLTDQCLRKELFNQCLASVPEGPTSTTVSNDWSEVVEECGGQAYSMAQRKQTFIKPECAW